MNSNIRILSIITAVILSFDIGYGQNMNDIYNFQNHSIPYGTPRFMGMGGAMGAVGGDVSSIFINPAGGAVAVKNESSTTVGMEWNSNKASYYGNKTNTDSDMKINLFQAGVNFVFVTKDDYSSFNSFNFAINYSRRNNFNNDYTFQGRNTTITDWAGNNAIGSSIVEELFRNGNDGFNTPSVVLAKDLGILSEHKDIDGYYYYLPEASYNNIDQAARLLTSGYSNVTTFSAGINLENKIYLGMGFDFYTISLGDNHVYMDEWGFTRSNTLKNDGVANLYYDRYSDQKGWGSSFTVGIIGKVSDAMRLGFSWKTPARIYISEYYSYAMGAKFFNGKQNDGAENPTFAGPNDYSFRTPSEWTFSAAYVFGRTGILSVDYMLKDYSNMKFKDDPYFDFENEIIKEQMKLCHTLRVGGELRLYPVSIRAGFNYITSPYKDRIVERASQDIAGSTEYVSLPQGVGETMNASLGLGINISPNFTVDATYLGSKVEQYYYLYSPQLTDPMKNSLTSHHISLGVTWRF